MRVTRNGETLIVAPVGDLDVEWKERRETDLDEALRPPPRLLIFDLSDVDFVDSTGLGVIARCWQAVRNGDDGGEVRVRNASLRVRQTFMIAGLDQSIVTMEDD